MRWRAVAGIGAAGCALALIGSGSRASWVGAAVALGVVPARRTTLIAAAAVIAVALIVLAPRSGELVERPHGAGSRLDEWVVALRVVERHPWFGVGPEGYRLAIAEGVDDHYERTYGRDVVPDRAHSAPLDVALTLGIPAGVLWGAAAAAVIRTARRAAAADALCTGVAVAVVGYLANQTMLFPLIELDPVAWGLAGALVAATRPRPGDVPAPATVRGARLPVVRRVAAVAVTVGAFAVLAGGVGTLAADRFARRSVVAAARGDRAAELRAAARAVDLDGGTVRYRLLLAGAELDSGTVAGIDRAAAAVDAALAISPGDPVVRGERARIASSRAAATGDPGDIGDALSRWEDLVAGDPHRAAWQRGLALAAAEAGDALSARAALDRAAQLGDRLAPALLAELDRIEAGG